MKLCPNCLKTEITRDDLPCGDCGWKSRNIDGVLDFLSNQQRQETIHQEYNNNYEKLAQKNIKESNIDRTFLRRQARVLVTYLGQVKGARVCEIGVGQGFLCHELLQQSVESIVAVDVALSYLKQFAGNPRVEPYLANVETLPFMNRFDLVVSTDVMEHVLNVGSYLYCVNRALVKGGRIAIRVPYREGLLNYSPHCGYGHQFGHLRSFNKDILRIYLKQAGFRIIRFHIDGYSPYTPRNWVMQSRVGWVLIRGLHKYVDRRLKHWSDVGDLPKPIIAPILRPAEIVVVAEKQSDIIAA